MARVLVIYDDESITRITLEHLARAEHLVLEASEGSSREPLASSAYAMVSLARAAFVPCASRTRAVLLMAAWVSAESGTVMQTRSRAPSAAP